MFRSPVFRHHRLRLPLSLAAALRPAPLTAPATATSGARGGGGGCGWLHLTRPLLAPKGRGRGRSAVAASSAHAPEVRAAPDDSPLPDSATFLGTMTPEECSVESVLLPEAPEDATSITVQSLRGLAQLLLDPEADGVEDVSMLDFVAMVPRRQLQAMGGNKVWLEVILGSERYQSSKDARALRLAGINSVGKWEEHPDRVAISPYSRGRLESAYRRMARQPQLQQKDQVIAWLTRTIQKAVVEEFVASAADQQNRQVLMPLIQGALPAVAAAAAATATGAPHSTTTAAAATAADAVAEAPADAEAEEYEEVIEEVEEEDEEAAEATAATTTTAATAGHRTRGKDDDDIERLMRMAEEEFATTTAAPDTDTTTTTTTTPTTTATTSGGRKSGRAAKAAEVEEAAADDEADETIAEVEETIEEIEEVEEEEAPEAAAVPSKPPARASKTDAKLERLAELMLTQFNAADGYLHNSAKELAAEEKQGAVLRLHDEAAQVDPLVLFSTFHAAAIDEESSSVAVRAIKAVWDRYNAHQTALEEATTEAVMLFEKQRGVDALVHGAVLLRAVSRDAAVSLDASQLPPFGFPLLSSDTRPAGQRRPRSSLHTDMNEKKVAEARKAYKAFFADKALRHSPFQPAIDCNAGCSTVMLSGSTLHLYETSMKDQVEEEVVRGPFAEALVGVLYALREKLVPRVNTVHYHILCTAPPAEENDFSTSPTSIVSIDLTGPFTNAERSRLKALAEPLGMGEEVGEFTCIEDIVIEIEESTGASVVHDLTQNRDDLEALLTPTLTQLLPTEGDLEEEQAILRESNKGTGNDAEADDSASAKSSKKNASSSAAAAAAAVQARGYDHEEEEEKEEGEYAATKKSHATPTRRGGSSATMEDILSPLEEEEEEEEEVVPVSGKKSSAAAAKGKVNDSADEDEEEYEVYYEEVEEEVAEGEEDEEEEAKPAAAAKKSVPLPSYKRGSGSKVPPPSYDEDEDEGAMEELAEEEEEEVVAAPPRRSAAAHAAAASSHAKRRTPPRRRDAVTHHDDDEDEENADAYNEPQQQQPVRLAHRTRAAAPATRRPVHYEDEEEEVPVPARSRRGAAAPPPPPAAKRRFFEDVSDVEGDDEEEAMAPPPVRRAQAKVRRTAPPPEEEEAESLAEEPQWFKRKTKKRYFS